jgi:hypothetical protein
MEEKDHWPAAGRGHSTIFSEKRSERDTLMCPIQFNFFISYN